MKKEMKKEQSLATKFAISATSFGLLVVGVFTAAIGTVDQVWEHTLGMCIALSSVLVFDEIEDKIKFMKDIKSLFE